MLKRLYIKNFALIEEITVDFHPSLNVITGETGAGKSILVDALSLTLGERASVEMIRSGTDRAIIEAVFEPTEISALKALFEENELDYCIPLTVRRELSAKGQNRCFVNDMLITNALLKQIGDILVDLHGQHEHQSLLRSDLHIRYLDAFAGIDDQLKEIRESYETVQRLIRQKNELIQQQKLYAEQKDLFAIRLKDLRQIQPQAGEDENLIQEEKLLMSSEKRFMLSKNIYSVLYESEPALIPEINRMEKSLQELRTIDPRVEDIAETFQNAKIFLEEFARWVDQYNRKIVFDPERLEEIRARLMQLQKLKKQYGSLSEAVARQKEMEEWMNRHDHFEYELQQLDRSILEAMEHYRTLADRLTLIRRQAGKKLDEGVKKIMKQLGMDGAVFQTRVDVTADPDSWFEWEGKRCKATATGKDDIEFYLSANPGESPKPLIRVASGGEVSRIMLSLKSVLAQADAVPTLIFDEIDVGISGRIAQAVARSLSHLAHSHQVIVITHLPQIASMGEWHYTVEKSVSNGVTKTHIRELDRQERIREIAKLLGGDTVNDHALRNAEALLQQATEIIHSS